jgi:hypothetical protein
MTSPRLYPNFCRDNFRPSYHLNSRSPQQTDRKTTRRPLHHPPPCPPSNPRRALSPAAVRVPNCPPSCAPRPPSLSDAALPKSPPPLPSTAPSVVLVVRALQRSPHSPVTALAVERTTTRPSNTSWSVQWELCLRWERRLLCKVCPIDHSGASPHAESRLGGASERYKAN